MIDLKIGRHTYKITAEDEFMDNGVGVLLLTQSEETSYWGSRPRPVLSKKAIKAISKFKRVELNHSFSEGTSVFSLRNK